MLRHLQSGLAAENVNQVMLRKKNYVEKEIVHDAENMQHFFRVLHSVGQNQIQQEHTKYKDWFKYTFYISMCDVLMLATLWRWDLCKVLPLSGENQELHHNIPQH